MKQLAGDTDKGRVERLYRRGGPDRVRIAALQTLLNDLGFGRELNWDRYGADGDYGRSTAAAVSAFAAHESLDANGKTLTMPLARRIVDQLGALYGADWWSPSHESIPAPGSLSVKSVMRNNNRQYLEVSDGVHKKLFGKFHLGLFTQGSQRPSTFVQSHADDLRALKVTESEINVMIAVAENEGNLDAVNTWDNAFLSFGLFQWTTGTGSGPGELPALLARIKDENRDLFDKYCVQHGLDVTDVTPGQAYGYFSFRGSRIKSPEAKVQLREPAWAFNFWLAGQDLAVQAMEIKHALGRLDQFYDSDSFRVDNKYRVSDLVTSEYGVGLILDNHVNRPGYVKACLSKALTQTGLGNPARWRTEDERKLIDAYLKIRVTYGRSPMTNADKRARVTRKYLANGMISDRRGSFKRSASA